MFENEQKFVNKKESIQLKTKYGTSRYNSMMPTSTLFPEKII